MCEDKSIIIAADDKSGAEDPEDGCSRGNGWTNHNIGSAMKYTVHLRAVVRVPLEIEAGSRGEAVKKAVSEYQTRYCCPVDLPGSEVTGEVVNEFLVNDEGDEFNENTSWHWYDGGQVVEMPEDEPSCLV